jgi:hypothetical protein
VRGLSEPHLKKQWLRLRTVVDEELQTVTALDAECATLRCRLDAPPSRAAVEVRCAQTLLARAALCHLRAS